MDCEKMEGKGVDMLDQIMTKFVGQRHGEGVVLPFIFILLHAAGHGEGSDAVNIFGRLDKSGEDCRRHDGCDG